MATKVGMIAKKKSNKKDETKELKARIAELEKENVDLVNNVETLEKENEGLKARIAELEKPSDK